MNWLASWMLVFTVVYLFFIAVYLFIVILVKIKTDKLSEKESCLQNKTLEEIYNIEQENSPQIGEKKEA